jgi:hypothetical protein
MLKNLADQQGGKAWTSFDLDYAKIIHEYQRYNPEDDHSLQTTKMQLVRQALLKDPNNAGLWVHLYLFSNDEITRGKAIFQAYSLDPYSTFV